MFDAPVPRETFWLTLMNLVLAAATLAPLAAIAVAVIVDLITRRKQVPTARHGPKQAHQTL